LIATGGEARKLKVPGSELQVIINNYQNVVTLRNNNDVKSIQNIMGHAKKIVIIGGSFIGCETASCIKKELKDAVDVTVVDSTKTIFERVLGS
jgi:NAD(P)H-nitrite reductase large subunit